MCHGLLTNVCMHGGGDNGSGVKFRDFVDLYLR